MCMVRNPYVQVEGIMRRNRQDKICRICDKMFKGFKVRISLEIILYSSL